MSYCITQYQYIWPTVHHTCNCRSVSMFHPNSSRTNQIRGDVIEEVHEILKQGFTHTFPSIQIADKNDNVSHKKYTLHTRMQTASKFCTQGFLCQVRSSGRFKVKHSSFTTNIFVIVYKNLILRALQTRTYAHYKSSQTEL